MMLGRARRKVLIAAARDERGAVPSRMTPDPSKTWTLRDAAYGLSRYGLVTLHKVAEIRPQGTIDRVLSTLDFVGADRAMLVRLTPLGREFVRYTWFELNSGQHIGDKTWARFQAWRNFPLTIAADPQPMVTTPARERAASYDRHSLEAVPA